MEPPAPVFLDSPRHEIAGLLESAIRALLNADAKLVELDVSERCLMHRLGFHLSFRFPGWNVDCEYNREGHDACQSKRVYRPSRSVSLDDERRIFPDIIVHRRTKAENLLVVELKKSSNRQSGAESDDLEKLGSLVHGRLAYRHGAFLRICTDDSMSQPFAVDWFERREVS